MKQSLVKFAWRVARSWRNRRRCHWLLCLKPHFMLVRRKTHACGLALMSAHVSKIFTLHKCCSTYIHRNSIVQKNVWRRNWYSLHTYVRTQYKPKILHTGPILVEQWPRCNCEWDRNLTRQAVKSDPHPWFDGVPPSPIHEGWGFVVVPILMSAHVSKIFKLRIFCSTYIHRNSILQKNIQRRNIYSPHTYVRTQYKPKILHT